MSQLQQLVESFVKKVYKKVKRNDRSYKDTYTITLSEVTRLIGMYKDCIDEDQTARLIRDSIDHWIRRYHDYSIRGDIGAHYRQTGIVQGDTVFEHVIPANEIRDMLIEGKLTVKQALNAPTCLINKSDDVILRKTGLGASSPSCWQFFKRYQGLNSSFTTYNGQKIDLDKWTLEDHYCFFNITE
jgi:hypothetical protein